MVILLRNKFCSLIFNIQNIQLSFIFVVVFTTVDGCHDITVVPLGSCCIWTSLGGGNGVVMLAIRVKDNRSWPTPPKKTSLFTKQANIEI